MPNKNDGSAYAAMMVFLGILGMLSGFAVAMTKSLGWQPVVGYTATGGVVGVIIALGLIMLVLNNE